MGKTLSAILTFILAGGIFFLYTKPAYTGPGTPENPSVNEIKVQIAQYDEALKKVEELEGLKQRLLAKFNSFNTDDVTRLETMIPDHVDNIGLILELDKIASKYGMTLENVDVDSAPASRGGQVASAGATIDAGNHYDSLSLRFSTFGTYDDFNTFLQDLEASLRLVDLESLQFSSQETTTSRGELTYNYNIAIKTYWLK